MARADRTIEHQDQGTVQGAAIQKRQPDRLSFNEKGFLAGFIPPVWLLFVALILVALACNLYRLGQPSIWFDEAFSVELARQPLPLLWRIIFGPEPNMELYYLLLHFWLQLTSALGVHPVEWVVRLPSALCAALSTGLVFLLGRRYLGRAAGSVAALLYALNYLQLTYAQQTRAYALQLLLLCLSWLALLAVCAPDTPQKTRWRWLVIAILSMTLAIYAHLFSVLVLLAQVIALAGLCLLPGPWRAAARRQILPLLGSFVITGILSIPMLLESLLGAKTGWLPVPHLNELRSLLVIISGDTPRYTLVMGASLVLGLGLIGVGLVLSRWPGEAPRARMLVGNAAHAAPLAWVLLCWLIVPIVVSYVVSQGSLRLFSTRYLVVVVPAFCLLCALSVALIRWLPARLLLVLVLLVTAALVTPHYYPNAQVENWNSTVHWLQQRYQAGDGLVCYDNEMNQGCQTAVEYYLHAYPGEAHISADTPGLFSWETFGPAHAQSGFLAALDPQALTTFASHHTRFFMIVGRVPDANGATRAQETVQWLDQHYHLTDQIQTPTVTIRLYTTTSAHG